MARFAHTESGAALDPADAESEQAYLTRFHPAVTESWVVMEVPAGVAHGARLAGGIWVNPQEQLILAPYKLLSKLQFKRLCVSAGGMTGEMYVASNADPLFKEFWLDFQLADEIAFDDETVNAGLEALAGGGYLPNGVDAVKAAWPRM